MEMKGDESSDYWEQGMMIAGKQWANTAE